MDRHNLLGAIGIGAVSLVKFVGLVAGLFVALLALLLAIVWGVLWWKSSDNYADYRNGVTVHLNQAAYVRADLLSRPLPLEIGYAETDRCHAGSGALLLRSAQVRRVLLIVDAPVCEGASETNVFRIVAQDRLPQARRFDTAAFWLERQADAAASNRPEVIGTADEEDAGVGAIRLVRADPWRTGFLINCSDDQGRYSLRSPLPDLLYGGSRFEPIASVDFFWGDCLDPSHWPKIEALIDLIGSLGEYKERGRIRP